MPVSELITLYASFVLGSVLMVVVLAMVVGLFQKDMKDDIFGLISPAFQTIVGAFVGLISGIHIAKKESDDAAKKLNSEQNDNPPAKP